MAQTTLRSAGRPAYDVVIVGGAMMGSAVAWWLSLEPGFSGSVLVVERDPSYEGSSTAASNSCIRQQFSNELNVQISQFTADFIRTFPDWFEDPDVPSLATHYFGYMYLAATEAFAATLRANQALQASWGGRHADHDAGGDRRGLPLLQRRRHRVRQPQPHRRGVLRRRDDLRHMAHPGPAQRRGVLHERGGRNRPSSTTGSPACELATRRDESRCGTVVNAAGPRAALVAAMAGVDLPVEPRKRYSFTFDAAEPLDRALPLTIDPTGVHCRSDGGSVPGRLHPRRRPRRRAPTTGRCRPRRLGGQDLAGPRPPHPCLRAGQGPQPVGRDTTRTTRSTRTRSSDPHPTIENFVFINGFSGHGLQQSPAMGRGVAEMIAYGEYRSLDLTPLGFERILADEPFLERAVI